MSQIPISIGDCRDLTVVSLQDNDLTGPIPSSLGRCSSLCFLHCEFLFQTVCFLSKTYGLKTLVYSNKLAGKLPAELAELKTLIELRLWGNQLTGEIPVEYRSLGCLKVLHLANNRLTGKVCSHALVKAFVHHPSLDCSDFP